MIIILTLDELADLIDVVASVLSPDVPISPGDDFPREATRHILLTLTDPFEEPSELADTLLRDNNIKHSCRILRNTMNSLGIQLKDLQDIRLLGTSGLSIYKLRKGVTNVHL